MVLAKSKKKAGLGNTLMNDRFGKGKGSDRKKSTAVTRINHATGEEYLVNDKQDAAWVKMRSVTEQGALDEFLATAELAGTDFTAEKTNNVKIIHTDQRNPYLLSAHEERVMLGKQKANKGRLTVPRRPQWDSSTTPAQLDRAEREAFLGWRRGLAELQENNDLLMTPFERNIEVWRQLWRVIERSDLVVQIVDARNPLLFRSADLEDYVKAVDSSKENLLLINKSDMMTKKQRRAWAKHLREAGIAYKFFSAHLAKERNEALEKGLESEDEPVVIPSSSKKAGKQRVPQDEESSEEDSEDSEDSEESDEEDGGARTVNSDEEDIQILTVEELEDIFLKYAPNTSDPDHKLQVGLVGYPNVGKSSTINALIGSKKVSVSATPGKTKHFQTIHLSERVLLCDCPGLVFPNFASTKADLVCNGILPIDQMRESAGPVGLLTRRIPKRFLEATYGIHIKTRPIEEGGTGEPTAEEFLRAYAQARGYQTQGLGQPDISRAARYVLKDYVNGKLLYVAPPPGVDDGSAFNRELYDEYHLPAKRRAALVAAAETLTVDDPTPDPSTASVADPVEDDISVFSSDLIALPAGPKSKKLDGAFFGPGSGKQGHLTMPFNHKYTEQGAVDPEANRLLSGRKQRTMIALEHGMDPKDVQVVSGKKHFKGNGKAGKGRRRGVRHDLDD